MNRKSFMQVMAIMLVSVLGLVVSSCKGDDDQDEIINVKDAVGTWMCVESQDTSNIQRFACWCADYD